MQKSEKADMEVDPITDLISLFFSPLSLDLSMASAGHALKYPTGKGDWTPRGGMGGHKKKKLGEM